MMSGGALVGAFRSRSVRSSGPVKGSGVMQSSRRNFLRSASVAAAGAVVVAGVGTGVASAEPESSAAAHKGSFVAWVKDPQSGQIAVLVEDREVVVTDKKLAKRLAQVAARAKRAS